MEAGQAGLDGGGSAGGAICGEDAGERRGTGYGWWARGGFSGGCLSDADGGEVLPGGQPVFIEYHSDHGGGREGIGALFGL